MRWGIRGDGSGVVRGGFFKNLHTVFYGTWWSSKPIGKSTDQINRSGAKLLAFHTEHWEYCGRGDWPTKCSHISESVDTILHISEESIKVTMMSSDEQTPVPMDLWPKWLLARAISADKRPWVELPWRDTRCHVLLFSRPIMVGLHDLMRSGIYIIWSPSPGCPVWQPGCLYSINSRIPCTLVFGKF